ncbi:MAG: sugar phosphate nucleotidyltransferase [Patescibacteria group bacterium]
MAGGTGTRLWPLSRREKPKQFQQLVGDTTLLQEMYRLLSNSFPPEHIFIQTTPSYLHFVKEQLPQVSSERILVEPEIRDTAPAFAYMAARIAALDEKANVGIFFSDHLIETPSRFTAAIEHAFKVVTAFPEYMVLVGVSPLFPHTGLGYIQLDPKRKVGANTYRVKSFVEKPNATEARRLARSDTYLWNTGYKIMSVQRMLHLLSSTKEYASAIQMLKKAIREDDDTALRAVYTKFKKKSFEYVFTERAKNLAVVRSNMRWSDVGDWETVHRILTKKKKSGLHTGGKVIQHDSKNTLLLSNHRSIVAVGVEGLIVVETENAVLVMSKYQSQDIKRTIEKLIKQEPDLL